MQHKITKRWSLNAEIIEVKKRSCLVRAQNGCIYWRKQKYLRRNEELQPEVQEEQKAHGKADRSHRYRRNMLAGDQMEDFYRKNVGSTELEQVQAGGRGHEG